MNQFHDLITLKWSEWLCVDRQVGRFMQPVLASSSASTHIHTWEFVHLFALLPVGWGAFQDSGLEEMLMVLFGFSCCCCRCRLLF